MSREALGGGRHAPDGASWMAGPAGTALDHKARRLGVTRQALVKLWIAERLGRAA